MLDTHRPSKSTSHFIHEAIDGTASKWRCVQRSSERHDRCSRPRIFIARAQGRALLVWPRNTKICGTMVPYWEQVKVLKISTDYTCLHGWTWRSETRVKWKILAPQMDRAQSSGRNSDWQVGARRGWILRPRLLMPEPSVTQTPPGSCSPQQSSHHSWERGGGQKEGVLTNLYFTMHRGIWQQQKQQRKQSKNVQKINK